MRALLAILLALTPVSALAQDFPLPQGKPVVDQADLLPAEREAALNEKLFAYEKRTGHQLVVTTVNSLEGRTIEDYAETYFETVGIGGADKDDGTLLLIAPNERKGRIETGYGMRTILTDAETSIIQRDEMVPYFKAGDYATGIESAAAAIMKKTTPLTAAETALMQREKAAQAARSAARWAAFKDFFLSLFAIIATVFGGFGLFKLAALPAKRRAARELEEARAAEAKRREEARAQAALDEAARREKEERERIAEQKRERARERRREAARLAEIARIQKERDDFLAAMTPAARKAFLEKEEADRLFAIEQERILEQERRERARIARVQREREEAERAEAARLAYIADTPRREAAERKARQEREAREEREEEERRERRRRDDEESARRSRDSYSSSSSSSSSSSDSFSGGGGDSGGGGSSSSW